MTRTELLALAERVEASAPDRELDAQVALAAGVVPEGAFRPCASPDPGTFGTGAYTHWVAPRYMSSIDAAASLVPPGAGVTLERYWLSSVLRKDPVWSARLHIGTEGRTAVSEDMPSAAIALTAAVLRARAEEAGE